MFYAIYYYLRLKSDNYPYLHLNAACKSAAAFYVFLALENSTVTN